MNARALMRRGAGAMSLPRRAVRPLPDARARMAAVDHLDELRRRLVASLVWLVGGFTLAFVERERLIGWLNEPLDGAAPITLGITEPFFTAIKVSAFAAFLLTFPILLWHAWRFIAPTVDRHARRTVATYVAAGSLLMVAGVAFAWLVALPSAVGFLVGFDSELYQTQVRAQEYYVFASSVLLSVGFVFQLPVALLALVRFRILSHRMLANNRRIAYVSLMALAVLMPGVDPVTTMMWIVPLGLMFEVSVLLARRVERRARRTEWETAAADMDERLAFSGVR